MIRLVAKRLYAFHLQNILRKNVAKMMPRIHISVLCGDIQTRLGDNKTYVRVLRISQTIFFAIVDIFTMSLGEHLPN